MVAGFEGGGRVPGFEGAGMNETALETQFQAVWEQGLFAARLDLQGVVLEANRAAVEDCGFTRQEILRQPFWECGWWNRDPQIQRWVRDGVEQALAGKRFRAESRYFSADGSERVLDFVCMPIKDAAGRVQFVVSTGMDITGRVEAAQDRQDETDALRESEQRFRAFANAAPAILWITEADGTCSFISRAWYEYSGQNEDAALGFGWTEMVHPADREQARAAFLEANERGEAFSLVARVRRADGEFRWVLSSGRPRFNARGEFAGYTGSMVDVHERNEETRAAALLGAIVDSCDDAIISKDLNGVITSWNRGAERLFGYTADEATGRSIEMLIPPERLGEEPKILSELRRGQRVDHFETIRVHKNGTRLNISVTISPIRDASGRVVGASKVARDITENVRHEQALQAANAALQRANADLEQFAYSASHDLQEPLRMVAAYSQLLQQKFGGQLGPAGDEIIGHTVEGALRMERLLKDLRIYTQVSASEEEPPEEVDADQILNRTLASLEVAIADSGATVSSTELPRVCMHEFQLEQLFQNLISNAIRYRGAEPPRIRVSAERQGREWRFAVADNGIGIDPRFQHQVFGIFKRLHSASEYPGTGMGLAICKRIVERPGGRIWVESELGCGSTFYFTIPCAAGAHA
jgi:PAS domain S-box-containing protein